ncbi:MAG: GNAT family N-acetyltransferase [Actinomycetota bacterium]|nr:GNAT family N-acetyltransferase [Actinomycetota bacterium]
MGSARKGSSQHGSMEGLDVVARTAAAGELDQAGEICVAAYQADGVTSSEYARLLGDAQDRARSAEVLVAVAESGRVLGTVTYLAREGPYAQIRRDTEAELRMLAVAPNVRRGGIGALLVQACIQKAIADGLDAIAISTSTEMHSAHRLYQRLGFQRNASRDWSPRRGLSLHVYELGLGRAGTSPGAAGTRRRSPLPCAARLTR